MNTPLVAVWYDNAHYQLCEDLNELAQLIHRMTVSEADILNKAYRLKNRITLVYRQGEGGFAGSDPIFELDSMRLNNYSSTEYAYLTTSEDGDWELRDEDNNLVSLKAIDEAKDINNYFKSIDRFHSRFPKSGL